MIWFRRAIAVLLILIFLLIFPAALVLNRVNATVLSADFYINQLRKADVFSFAYDELIPGALDELGRDSTKMPVEPEVIEEKLLLPMKEVLPPEWLQEQAEAIIRQVVPYAMGQTDSFAITIPVKERLETLGIVMKRELGSEDTYNLILDDIAAPALEDILEEDGRGDLSYGITITSQDVMAAVKEVFPHSWVQPRLNHVVDQVVPYLIGDAQNFSITTPVGDRLEALVPVLKRLLVRAEAYQILNSQEFADAVERELRESGELPLGVKLTGQQLTKALREMAPPQWLQARAESLIDAIVPYLSGRQQSFEIVVPLKGRVQTAMPVLKQLLREADAYNLLFDELIAMVVEKNVGAMKDLPLGITLTSEDIAPLVKQVLPAEFIQEQAEKMIDQLVPYLTGEAESFRVVVPLAERKAPALRAIQELADKKLKEAASLIPKCTAEQAVELVKEGFTGALPPCLPVSYSPAELSKVLGIDVPGSISYEQIQAFLGVDITLLRDGVTLDIITKSLNIDVMGQVEQLIGNSIPDEFAFTDVDLRRMLGPEREEWLDKALDWTGNGFTFTDADLRERLDPEQEEWLDKALDWTRNGFTFSDADLREQLDSEQTELLDQALKWTREGFTFTDVDLRERLADSQEGQEALNQLDQARNALGLVKRLSPFTYLLPAVLLVGIGFLGGRRWRSRLAWAAVPLLIAAGTAYIAFGPVYHSVVVPLLERAMEQASSQATGVGLLAAQKSISMGRSAIDDFASGLAGRALFLLVVSVLALALAIFWPRLFRLWRRPQPPSQPQPEG